MTEQLNAAIQQVVTLSQFEGIAPVIVLESVRAAFNLPAVNEEWNADGTSKPNELGLIRFKALEEFKSQLNASGHEDAAKFVRTWWACQPAIAQLTPYSRYWWQDLVEVSEAGNVMVNPFDAPVVNKWHEGNPNSPLPSERYIEERGVAVDDAGSIPGIYKTVNECLAYVKNMVKQYLDASNTPAPQNVDFSPAMPAHP